MSASPHEPPGSLGEEASKLFAAAQDWFASTVGDATASKIATGAPECAWCPVCQLIGVLRGDRPELTERLADTQAALAGLFRALADVASTGMQQHANHRPDRGGVQKIDLDGE
jgi:hypothetical protein